MAPLHEVEQSAPRRLGPSPDVLYALACVDALVAARTTDAGKGEPYAARAVDLLRQASGHGYDPAAGMKTDSALAGLRARADFRKLAAELAEGK
jgi:hypothetical protein